LGASFIASALLKMGSTSFLTNFAFLTIYGITNNRFEASERQRATRQKKVAAGKRK
jgi:hypothetical protein